MIRALVKALDLYIVSEIVEKKANDWHWHLIELNVVLNYSNPKVAFK